MCRSVTTQHPGGLRLLHAAGSAGAMHLFREGDRLMDQLFNIVGIMLVGASAGATEGIIKNSIMLHSGKRCTTVSKRTIPHCGLKPQLKRGVEHDCYIYAWNSACTMEGVDIVMV